MSDRIAEIREDITEWNEMGVIEQMRRGDDWADGFASDIEWLLDEVEKLHQLIQQMNDRDDEDIC